VSYDIKKNTLHANFPSLYYKSVVCFHVRMSMKALKILVLAAAVCSFSSLAADNASKDESLGDKMSAIGSNIQKKGAKVGEKISDGAVYTKDKVADGYDYTKGKVVDGYEWSKDKVQKGAQYTKEKFNDGVDYVKEKTE